MEQNTHSNPHFHQNMSVMNQTGIFSKIIEEQEAKKSSGTQNPSEQRMLNPLELESYLKQYIVDQDDAIEMIATKICIHFNRMILEKQCSTMRNPIQGTIKNNILILGPSGSGKTYLMQLVANKIGVPFVKADATKFTETGYVGGDADDLVRELTRKANNNLFLAEHGIVFLDEIDKIATSGPTRGRDIAGTGVQHNLLKLMEDTDIDLKNPMDLAFQMESFIQAQQSKTKTRKTINTKNILFVMSGAFQDIGAIVQKRIHSESIGFHSKPQKDVLTDYLQFITRDDLIQFGFETEFISRFPIIATFKPLTNSTLRKILKTPKNGIIQSKKRDFQALGISLDFTEDALDALADLVDAKQSGARDLASVLERTMLPFEKWLPSSGISHHTVTKQDILNPKQSAWDCLAHSAIQLITSEFRDNFKISLQFDETVFQFLRCSMEKENTSPLVLLQNHLKDSQHGLKLIKSDNILITAALFDPQQKYLDKLIQQHCKTNACEPPLSFPGDPGENNL